MEKRQQEFLPIEYKFTPPGPYWECVVQTGGTFTTATDWSLQFEPDRNPVNRAEFRWSTAGGELHIPHFHGGTSTAPTRATLVVYAHDWQDVKFVLSADGSGGGVQIKVNGTITEYTGPLSQFVTITLRPGENVIVVSKDSGSDQLAIQARFFDGRYVNWVDPRGARNPARPDVSQPGSAGTTIPGVIDTVPDLPETGP